MNPKIILPVSRRVSIGVFAALKLLIRVEKERCGGVCVVVEDKGKR